MNESMTLHPEEEQVRAPEISYDGDYVTINCDYQTALGYIEKIYNIDKRENRSFYFQAKQHQGYAFNCDFYDHKQRMIRMQMDVFGDDIKIVFGGGGNSLVQDAMKESIESILDIEIN